MTEPTLQDLTDRVLALETIIETVLPLLLRDSPNRARIEVLLTRLESEPPFGIQNEEPLHQLIDALLPARAT